MRVILYLAENLSAPVQDYFFFRVNLMRLFLHTPEKTNKDKIRCPFSRNLCLVYLSERNRTRKRSWSRSIIFFKKTQSENENWWMMISRLEKEVCNNFSMLLNSFVGPELGDGGGVWKKRLKNENWSPRIVRKERWKWIIVDWHSG